MKISKEKQEKLAKKLEDPVAERFSRFVKRAIIIAAIASAIIAVAVFIFLSNNHAKDLRQLIQVLLFAVIVYSLWALLKRRVNTTKQWVTDFIDKKRHIQHPENDITSAKKEDFNNHIDTDQINDHIEYEQAKNHTHNDTKDDDFFN